MGDGVTEIGHKAIAHILSVVPFILFNDLFRDLMKIIDRVSQIFRGEVRTQYAGVYEIAAQQRHLPSVRGRFGGCVGGAGSIICRNIRVRDVSGKPPRRDSPTTIAKIVTWRNLTLAFSAIQCKCATATAELGTLPIFKPALGTPHASSPLP